MRLLTLFAFLLATSRAEAQSCEIVGTAPVAHVRVTPAGGTPFVLDLEALPLAVTPGPPGAHVQVRTTGALALQGTAATSEVSLAFARPTALADGVLRAGRNTRVVSFVGDGASARVDLELERGVTVGIVAAPCASLRVAPRPPERPIGRSRGALVPTGNELAISVTPGGPTALTVRFENPYAVRLQRLGARNAFVHVHARLAYAEIDGWVPSSSVQAATPGTQLGQSGAGAGPLARHTCAEAHEGVYVGPATLQPGAEITDRDGHVWARAVRTLAVRVVRGPGAPRARVQSIAGVFDHEGCEGFLDRAFVASSALVLPRGVPPEQTGPAPQMGMQ